MKTSMPGKNRADWRFCLAFIYTHKMFNIALSSAVSIRFSFIMFSFCHTKLDHVRFDRLVELWFLTIESKQNQMKKLIKNALLLHFDFTPFGRTKSVFAYSITKLNHQNHNYNFIHFAWSKESEFEMSEFYAISMLTMLNDFPKENSIFSTD